MTKTVNLQMEITVTDMVKKPSKEVLVKLKLIFLVIVKAHLILKLLKSVPRLPTHLTRKSYLFTQEA